MMQQKSDIEGAPFVVKTYSMVSDPANKDSVSWSSEKDRYRQEQTSKFIRIKFCGAQTSRVFSRDFAKIFQT